MAFWPGLWREFRRTLDYLLPPACLACGTLHACDRRDVPWCSDCARELHQLTPSYCPRCATPHQSQADSLHTCEECLRNPPPFTRVHACGRYTGRLKETIQQFKYRGRLFLELPLARLVSTQLARSLEDFTPDLVIPVPLHISRLRQRGFNQAHQLARHIAAELQVPEANHLLKRHRKTRSQSELNAPARQDNLRDAFCLCGAVTGKRILLIDDVMTTGATARACSSELLAGGAAEVQVAVLGRA